MNTYLVLCFAAVLITKSLSAPLGNLGNLAKGFPGGGAGDIFSSLGGSGGPQGLLGGDMLSNLGGLTKGGDFLGGLDGLTKGGGGLGNLGDIVNGSKKGTRKTGRKDAGAFDLKSLGGNLPDFGSFIGQ